MRPTRYRRGRGARVAAAALLLALAGCRENGPMFPSPVAGYAVSGPGARYGPDDLHTYIDGAAEVYRAFGVAEVLARRYERPGFPEIAVDLFDMGSAEGAFGAFHHDVREGEPAGIGRESERAGATLAFWKGRFFVSILPSEENGAVAEAVVAIGRAIADTIRDEGEPPRLLGLLPTTGRVVRGVRYVPGKAILDRYYFLADEDLLDLDGAAAAVLAGIAPRGGAGEAGYRVLLVGYPGQEAAERAARRFRNGYLHDADAEGLARTESGGWTAIGRLGDRLVVIVLDAPSREEAAAALEEIGRREKGETP